MILELDKRENVMVDCTQYLYLKCSFRNLLTANAYISRDVYNHWTDMLDMLNCTGGLDRWIVNLTEYLLMHLLYIINNKPGFFLRRARVSQKIHILY